LKAVYVTPAAQLPTGVVLSDARRRALLELADETQTPIIEDDYDSEFRFGDAAPPALKTRDHAGQVVYVGTFSKAVFPGLRLGYAVAAPALRDRLAVAQLQSSFGTDGISQAAMAELLASGAFERHVRRLRNHYADRRAALLESLAAELPADAHWFRPRGGLQVFVTLPGSVSGPRLREAALARGIAWSSGESFHLDGRGADQLALSFANLEPAALRQGVAAIGELVRELADPPAGGRRSRGGRDA
jgi:DNA-binding transcriptional MocR family regulator